MLTGKEIGRLIAHPEEISSGQLNSIAELADKYPYSQLFSILYLKAMHASESLDFEAELQKHSYRISDRVQLYQLIESESERKQEVEQQVANLEESARETEDIATTIETSSLREEDDFELATEESLESEVTTISSETEDEPTVSVESEAENEEGLEEADLLPIDLPNDPLEENILHHVVASNYQLKELTPEEEKELENRENHASISESKKDQAKTIEADKDLIDTDADEKLAPEISLDGKQSFTSWLHSDTNYEEKEDESAPIRAVVKEFSDFDPLESLYGEVEKPKKEFFSPSKKAKESLSENQLPVSETLAKVYVAQGNYPKAIAAYNELILAFPEKKSFFADQIDQLKKKLNT